MERIEARNQLGYLTHDVARAITNAYDAQLRGVGLTRAQWRAIAYIIRTPGISQAQLAEEMFVGRMTITAIVSKLEKRGFIERKPNSTDMRVKEVYCTKKCLDLVPQMQGIADVVMAEILRGVSASEQKTLMKVLSKIYLNAQRVSMS